MIGRAIGYGFITARDALARVLVRIGITPNVLTLAGTGFTLAAGACYAAGAGAAFSWSPDPRAAANAFPVLAFAMLFLSSACDMLDGAVARIGNRKTTFGAFLDSTMDRLSDFAIYAGMALYYVWQTPGNLTFALLCMLAFFNGFMISYTRARAEDLIEFCTVGYWQRGERSAAILIATAAHNIPALILQQALLPLLTVLRRIFYTRAVLAGKTPVTDPRKGGVRHKLRLWRWPRGTIPYDVVTAVNIAWLLLAPVPARDLIREWLVL